MRDLAALLSGSRTCRSAKMPCCVIFVVTLPIHQEIPSGMINDAFVMSTTRVCMRGLPMNVLADVLANFRAMVIAPAEMLAPHLVGALPLVQRCDSIVENASECVRLLHSYTSNKREVASHKMQGCTTRLIKPPSHFPKPSSCKTARQKELSIIYAHLHQIREAMS